MAKKYWSRASNHDSSKPQKTHSVAGKITQKNIEHKLRKWVFKEIEVLKEFHHLIYGILVVKLKHKNCKK